MRAKRGVRRGPGLTDFDRRSCESRKKTCALRLGSLGILLIPWARAWFSGERVWARGARDRRRVLQPADVLATGAGAAFDHTDLKVDLPEAATFGKLSNCTFLNPEEGAAEVVAFSVQTG